LSAEQPVRAVYCTICDAPYVPRALALHRALLKFNEQARFAYFCVDELSASLLEELDLPRAIVVREESFATPALRGLRASRSQAEYCWTCKPFALEYLARTLSDADWLAYLDSDMLFFGDPDTALPRTQAHYLLTPHRYVPALAHYADTAGVYNGGYLAVRPTAEGLRVLEWWGGKCIERCSAQAIPDSYADQKYLDRLPALFPFGEESAHIGLNAAPWNIDHYRVAEAGGRVQLDDAPLLLYHFQSLRVLSGRLVDLYAGNRRLTAPVQRLIYEPYLDGLAEAYAVLREAFGARAPAPESRLHSARDWLRLGYEMARGYHNIVRRRLAA
jgi:hypothetical protein